MALVVNRVSESLSALAKSSARIAERDLMNSTQFELRRKIAVFHGEFAQVLREKIEQELFPRADSRRRLESANWQTLSLVDDLEMEERMFSDRIGQLISHECDVELRELTAYMGSLLSTSGVADQDRNPLRVEMLGTALYRSIKAVSDQPDARKLLARELGQAMAKAMPGCYLNIIMDLQARGIQPMVLTVRTVEGPGLGGNSGYSTLSSSPSQRDELDPRLAGSGVDAGSASGFAHRNDHTGGTPAGSSSLGGGHDRSPQESRYESGADAQTNAQLMSLLRRLTTVVGRPGDPYGAPHARAARSVHSTHTTSVRQATQGASFFDPGASSGSGPSSNYRSFDLRGSVGSGSLSNLGDVHPPEGIRGRGVTGLMAVNLIRAHREELLQASNGKLDHMVIDVVGSLFDQILSDSRVPPQLARQIARLQLPVLRVALNDSSFFSSRRHPVRRFVNRIASLACAFDDFDDGPGRSFLARVSELVQEIVNGDFDQIELYASKLTELEAFIANQTGDEAKSNGAASTLDRKETELRLQQRYMLELQVALDSIALPPYLRDFVAQVWSQALVLATSRDGPDSDRAQRYRRVGRDLVMSVQPKGTPALRKKFLMQLPPLMKDLNEGMQLVGWPEAAQRQFFANLLPAHAESLKGASLSELDYNMMVKQLEAIFKIALPGSETLSPADDLPEIDSETVARRFSVEEARRVGLVQESAVDWSGAVGTDIDTDTNTGTGTDTDLDIDLSAEPESPGSVKAQPGDSPILDLALDLPGAEPAEVTKGPRLMDHVRLGFAYQMHLKDDWQKVRLTHVSAGRSFFVFSRGNKHKETISMTSRMLARMCESGRMRAVESAYLMERAMQRARRQLAALKTPTRL